MMRYLPLYRLSLFHPYYQDGKCQDFTLVTTPECEQILRDFRLLAKFFPGGLEVLVPVKEEIVEETGENKTLRIAPFLNIPQNTRFSFWLKIDTPHISAITDLEKTFLGKNIANPVFTNEGLPTSEELKVKELEAFQSDRFFFPEKISENPATFPFILRNNPAKRPPELHIQADSNQSAEVIVDRWETLIKEQKIDPKGFSLEKMGNGTDKMENTPDYSPLIRPYQLTLFGIDSIEVSYHGHEDQPRVKVERGATSITSAELIPQRDPPRLTIQLTGNPGMRFPTWSSIKNLWNNRFKDLDKDNMGFRLSFPEQGDGKNNAQLTLPETGGGSVGVFKHLQIQERLEWVLPEKGLNGLKATYEGDHQEIPLVKVSVRDGPIAFDIRDEIHFESDRPEAIESIVFDKDTNVAWISATGLEGKNFSLAYPVKPVLPWGIFGRVDIHTTEQFTDFTPNTNPVHLKLAFTPKEYYWKYYVVIESDEQDANPTTNHVVNLDTENDQVSAQSFSLITLNLSTADVLASLVTFRDHLKGMEASEVKRFWEQLVEIESNLNLIKNAPRFLLVSNGKIPCKEKYGEQLKLQFVQKDLDIDKVATGIQEFTFDFFLPPPQNNETQVIRVKAAQLA